MHNAPQICPCATRLINFPAIHSVTMYANVQMVILFLCMFVQMDIESDSYFFLEGDKHVIHYRHYSFGTVAGWTDKLVYAWWFHLCGTGHRGYPVSPWLSQKRTLVQLRLSFIVRSDRFIPECSL